MISPGRFLEQVGIVYIVLQTAHPEMLPTPWGDLRGWAWVHHRLVQPSSGLARAGELAVGPDRELSGGRRLYWVGSFTSTR